jgi:hypothetical protein
MAADREHHRGDVLAQTRHHGFRTKLAHCAFIGLTPTRRLLSSPCQVEVNASRGCFFVGRELYRRSDYEADRLMAKALSDADRIAALERSLAIWSAGSSCLSFNEDSERRERADITIDDLRNT